MIAKVFLDTNVLLDCVVQGRDHATASIKVLDLVRNHCLEAVVTTQSIIDMAYVDRYSPTHEGFNRFVSWMLGHINVEHIDAFDIRDALSSGGSDFEDESQVAHAVTSACHYYITSNRGLLNKEIPGIEFVSPESFVQCMYTK